MPRDEMGRRKTQKQPFMLCQGSASTPKCFGLVVEDSFISCGAKCLNAFKNLFAAFFVFRLQYPTPLRPLYNFFESSVFKLNNPSPSAMDFMRTLDGV
jgi:hypothetical protein